MTHNVYVAHALSSSAHSLLVYVFTVWYRCTLFPLFSGFFLSGCSLQVHVDILPHCISIFALLYPMVLLLLNVIYTSIYSCLLQVRIGIFPSFSIFPLFCPMVLSFLTLVCIHVWSIETLPFFLT